MTCYLTDATNPDEVESGFRNGVFTAVKLYPANATTNSAAGVSEQHHGKAGVGDEPRIRTPRVAASHGGCTPHALDRPDHRPRDRRVGVGLHRRPHDEPGDPRRS